MAKSGKKGWTKSYREMEDSPVWPNHDATRIFQWMQWRAKTEKCRERVGRADMVLKRGQFFTTYEEVARCTYLNVKPVRNAFAFLRDLESISWEVNPAGRRGMLVTVVNYQKYQDRIGAAAPPGEEGEETQERIPESGQANGQGSGQAKTTNGGRVKRGDKPLSRKSKSKSRDEAGAGKKTGSGQQNGQANGQALLIGSKKIKKKRSNTPNPLLKKGGYSADNSGALLGCDRERVELVLGEWRKEWEGAGQAYLPDKRTVRGAEVLAGEWLNGARLSLDQLRGGMKKIIGLILNDPKCRNFDLATLAGNPSKYCPGKVVEKKKRRMVRWEMVCDVCGTCATVPQLAPMGSPRPLPVPCINADAGCQGTMAAWVCQELEVW